MSLLNRISSEGRRYPLRCLSWDSRGSSPPSAVADNNVIFAWMGVRRALRRWTLRPTLWRAFNLRGVEAYIFPRSLLFVKGNYLTCIWTLWGTRMSFQSIRFPCLKSIALLCEPPELWKWTTQPAVCRNVHCSEGRVRRTQTAPTDSCQGHLIHLCITPWTSLPISPSFYCTDHKWL